MLLKTISIQLQTNFHASLMLSEVTVYSLYWHFTSSWNRGGNEHWQINSDVSVVPAPSIINIDITLNLQSILLQWREVIYLMMLSRALLAGVW